MCKCVLHLCSCYLQVTVSYTVHGFILTRRGEQEYYNNVFSMKDMFALLFVFQLQVGFLLGFDVRLHGIVGVKDMV